MSLEREQRAIVAALASIGWPGHIPYPRQNAATAPAAAATR